MSQELQISQIAFENNLILSSKSFAFNSHGVSCNHSFSERWDLGYIGLSHTTDKVEIFSGVS